jgi:hypothetical protein
MAETKTESKATKIDVRLAAEREGIVSGLIGQSADLAERTTATAFGIARDVRVELNQRILGTLAFVEATQQGLWRLLRTVDERIDRLADELSDTTEQLVLGVIRTARNAGHGVTDLAGSLTAREVSRAA